VVKPRLRCSSFMNCGQVHAQVGFDEVVLAETCKARKSFGNSGLFRLAKLGTFHQGIRVIGLRILARFLEKVTQIVRPFLQYLVVPGSCGVTGQVKNVRHVFAGIKGNRSEVQNGRDQHDTVEVQAVMRLQIIGKCSGAEGAVAFTDEKLWEFHRPVRLT